MFTNLSAPNTLEFNATAYGGYGDCYPTETVYVTAVVFGSSFAAPSQTVAFVSPTTELTVNWGFSQLTLASIKGATVVLVRER